MKRLVCLAEARKDPVEEMMPGYGDEFRWVDLLVELRYPVCLQSSLSILYVSRARVAEHCCCSRASSEKLTRVFRIYVVF